VRYDSDQIESIVFDDGVVYVKRDIVVSVLNNKTREEIWVYEGNGILLYSAYTEGQEYTGNRYRTVRATQYYLQLGDDSAVWTATDYHTGGMINQGEANRSLIYAEGGYTFGYANTGITFRW
jgi:Zn/Cd-binding protein ZinT